MSKLTSKATGQQIEVGRIIGHIKGSLSGPTIIFTGGIHGNEPSGVFALNQVLSDLGKYSAPISGNIYALSGNLWALERGQRYSKQDLNRLWTTDNMMRFETNNQHTTDEDTLQQKEIYMLLRSILDADNGPFYFMDLHTTSSQTIPFLTVNDSLINREFTTHYPLPIILGIEEFLDGPLLSYINELGYIAFGYEGGQHDDPIAIENHISFIYLSLVFAGIMQKADFDYDNHYNRLSALSADKASFYEIYFRYQIKEKEDFSMLPGFENFQRVYKGQPIAISDGQTVKAAKNGKIFMPLYQKQGKEGFFAIRRISPFFLRLSTLLRNMGVHKLLILLPGVRWNSKRKEELLVNRKVARFFTKQIFHLLGYRSKRINKFYYAMKNREIASKNEDYSHAPWKSS